MTQRIVAKFGGTSLADASQIQKVIDIVKSNPQRRCIVVSAPGKRSPTDRKITDLLYLCQAHVAQQLPFGDIWQIITDRYKLIAHELGLTLDLAPLFQDIERQFAQGASPDYIASRGEYLTAHMLAYALDLHFIDATELVFFNERGQLDAPRTLQAIRDHQARNMAGMVIPGFYGAMPNGSIKTFTRGGSDITGALVAQAISARVYENWTDVSGLLRADPHIVPEAEPIHVVTYQELRELAYMGATIIHEEAVFPVRQSGIPIHIRNTNFPDHAGTFIVGQSEAVSGPHIVTGIAGRKGFTMIAIEKSLMNQQLGYARRVLSVLEANSISFEHMPSGIDSLSLVIADVQLEHMLDKVVQEIQHECQPDSIECYQGLALIAVVGRRMVRTPGSAARLFRALGEQGINVRMISQGSSEISIIVGVENSDFETAVRVIYRAF